MPRIYRVLEGGLLLVLDKIVEGYLIDLRLQQQETIIVCCPSDFILCNRVGKRHAQLNPIGIVYKMIHGNGANVFNEDSLYNSLIL